MNANRNDPEHWEDCRNGELGRLVSYLKRRRRTREMVRGASVAVVAMLVLICGLFLGSMLPHSEVDYGGIACSDVSRFAEDFLAGILDVETTRKIEQHLLRCADCRRLVEKLRAERQQHAAACCPHSIPPGRHASQSYLAVLGVSLRPLLTSLGH